MRNTAELVLIKKLSGDTKRRYVVQNKCPIVPDNKIKRLV